jgi:acetyltransferase
VPEVLDLICGHPDVDAVIHLGIGIQAGQAQLFRSGEFYPDHGLERIAGFHERQDRRYAEVAREVSERHGKPVLTCTELAVTDRAYGNAGPQGVKQEGRLCYPSAHRAISALAALVRYAEFRDSR